MHDLKLIVEDPSAFDSGLTRRGHDVRSSLILQLHEKRRARVAALQMAQESRNSASKEIAIAMGSNDRTRAEALKADVAKLKADLPGLEQAERVASGEVEALLAELPNIPLAEVPDGKDENANVILSHSGILPQFSQGFRPKEHFELGEALGLMDFEAAAKLSGARFVVLKGSLARLQRALGQFMLDVHTLEHDYLEVASPVLVRSTALYGTAQLPKFAEDLFQTTSDLWLIPTSEVSLTNLVRESILEESQLPLRFTALTPCFRAEAGSAGRDTRGMIRQHQFEKVELVSICTPTDSPQEHERMTRAAQYVLTQLGLAFCTVLLCAGDMGFASRKTYDIEVWLPGQNRYREISSLTQCGDFQARRMSARYRPRGTKSIEYVHTLNGSGVAVGRALIAVMENYQNEDGSIRIPEVLVPYMGGQRLINRV